MNDNAGRRPAPHRAESARVPATTRALERAELERKSYVTEREGLEHRSVVRGLIVLAVVVLLASIARAGLGRVFVQRWWHW